MNAKINPTHKRTYAGQDARIILAATLSSGRKIYALRTIGGVVATAFDSFRSLEALAAYYHLRLNDERNG